VPRQILKPDLTDSQPQCNPQFQRGNLRGICWNRQLVRIIRGLGLALRRIQDEQLRSRDLGACFVAARNVIRRVAYPLDQIRRLDIVQSVCYIFSHSENFLCYFEKGRKRKEMNNSHEQAG
jgi:hypothetical protein